jgi:hypothetical protein
MRLLEGVYPARSGTPKTFHMATLAAFQPGDGRLPSISDDLFETLTFGGKMHVTAEWR